MPFYLSSWSLVQLGKLAELQWRSLEVLKKINKVKRILKAICKGSVEPVGGTDTVQNAPESGAMLTI